MWLASNRGWYSVVAYDPNKDRTGRKLQGKPPYVLVRARVKKHLTHVKAMMPSAKIETDDRADYKFRMVVPVAVWKKFLHTEVDRIDYTNFKNSVVDKELHDAYMGVWGVMYRLQPLRSRFSQIITGRGWGKRAEQRRLVDDYEGPGLVWPDDYDEDNTLNGLPFNPLDDNFEDGCQECGCRQEDHEDGVGECSIKGCGCPKYINAFDAAVRDTLWADINALNDMTTGRHDG